MRHSEWGTSIEKQRAKLHLLEGKLTSFGFDARRGLETYTIQEIKKLARKNGFSTDFLEALDRCLLEHISFYNALHKKIFEPLSVERDMPEKNIQAIQEWLTHFRQGTPRRKASESISLVLYRHFLTELKRAQSPAQLEGWYEELKKSYKREYDIYRFVDLLARLYNIYAGSEVLVPNQHAMTKSAKEILRAAAEKKLQDSNFLEFLSENMNTNRRSSSVYLGEITKGRYRV